MNYWFHTAGRYRSTSILERVHKTFFNYYQFSAMTYMTDDINLARGMTTLILEFERALLYHDEGYKLIMTIGYHPKSQGLSVCTSYSQQRPPLTWLTSLHPSTQSHPSLQEILEAYHAKKGLLDPIL